MSNHDKWSHSWTVHTSRLLMSKNSIKNIIENLFLMFGRGKTYNRAKTHRSSSLHSPPYLFWRKMVLSLTRPNFLTGAIMLTRFQPSLPAPLTTPNKVVNWELSLTFVVFQKEKKKTHYLPTPLPNTKITFDSHTQRNSALEKLAASNVRGPLQRQWSYYKCWKVLEEGKKPFCDLLHPFIILWLVLWELTYICNKDEWSKKSTTPYTYSMVAKILLMSDIKRNCLESAHVF